MCLCWRDGHADGLICRGRERESIGRDAESSADSGQDVGLARISAAVMAVRQPMPEYEVAAACDRVRESTGGLPMMSGEIS